MGKLTEKQRKIVGRNCSSANVNNNHRKEVQVFTPGRENGEKVKGAIAAAYPNYKFYKYEDSDFNTTNHVLMAIFTLGAGNLIQEVSETWEDFTIECDSEENATALVKEIGDCIAKYAREDDTPNLSNSTGNGKDDKNGKDSDRDSEQQPTDWTTYIIIGAAALAIIILLWPKRKK